MINSITSDKPVTKKVFFVRVAEAEYRRIQELAEIEDRSANKTANRLLKSALDALDANKTS